MEEKKETTRRYRLQLNSMFRAKVSGQFSTVYRTDIFVVELDEENWDDLVSTGPTSEGDIVEVVSAVLVVELESRCVACPDLEIGF
ncbi:hypothetical protein HZH68_016904 [Vespula germanica]|uniref:Uncharacterized protein n=3 Tax=Vespula TaxID=7451 RepID=A0A834J0F8_VESGE|nr:hypothetical protein HZH66_015293 [Vespula vulgaris]KAF7379956.1 hypothetical protein HZH68_016904 [Vespula germanica]KAF7389737.1 hypothetical protein H0235_018221 [Vespula pensylvanica]